MRLPSRWLALVVVLLAPLLSVASDLTAAQGDVPGGTIAFVRDGDIWVWQGGDAERLIEDGNASDPQWSPSGQELLFVRTGDSYSDLILRYLDAGDEVALTENQSAAQLGTEDYANTSVWAIDPAWSPSGTIAFASDYFTPFSTMTLWWIQDLSLGPTQAPAAQEEGNIESVSLSSDGSIAAYTVRLQSEEGTNLSYVALRDLSDGVAYPITEDVAGAYDPAIAPDDQSVAVSIRSSDGMTDIWLVDRQTGDRTRVTQSAQAMSPVWSPDGDWLAYLRMVDYQFEIWAVPIDGSTVGEPQNLGRYSGLDATSGLSWTDRR